MTNKPPSPVAGPEDSAKRVADGLSVLLAETYTLCLKTRSFHWNVQGPLEYSLKLMFEQQYTELASAIDLIAERIRALHFPAPGSFAQFRALSKIVEETGVPSASVMIAQLVEGHETLQRTAQMALSQAQDTGDPISANFLTLRAQLHEKTAWMLRSMLTEMVSPDANA
jgi:starvation-inducible DNA-binding protein